MKKSVYKYLKENKTSTIICDAEVYLKEQECWVNTTVRIENCVAYTNNSSPTKLIGPKVFLERSGVKVLVLKTDKDVEYAINHRSWRVL